MLIFNRDLSEFFTRRSVKCIIVLFICWLLYPYSGRLSFSLLFFVCLHIPLLIVLIFNNTIFISSQDAFQHSIMIRTRP